MDDHTRLDLKVPVAERREPGTAKPDNITKPRHRAPSRSRAGLRVVGLMLAALVLAALGWCITLAGWCGYGAPLVARSVSVGAGIMLTLPVPMVGFWVAIRRVFR